MNGCLQFRKLDVAGDDEPRVSGALTIPITHPSRISQSPREGWGTHRGQRSDA